MYVLFSLIYVLSRKIPTKNVMHEKSNMHKPTLTVSEHKIIISPPCLFRYETYYTRPNWSYNRYSNHSYSATNSPLRLFYPNCS